MEFGGASIIASIDHRLVRWGCIELTVGRSANYSRSSRMGVLAFALLLLNGAMELWEDAGRQGSLVVAIVGWIVGLVHLLSITILVGVAWAAINIWSTDRHWRPEREA